MRILVALFLGAAGVSAHELNVLVEPAEPAMAVHATYAGSEPVTDADFSVFSPQKPDSPFQTGFTDLNGAFAFLPDKPGEWRVVVDDGFGHRAEQTVAVDWQSGEAPTAAGGARSSLDQAVLGLSIIFGVTGVLLWLQARRRTSGGSS